MEPEVVGLLIFSALVGVFTVHWLIDLGNFKGGFFKSFFMTLGVVALFLFVSAATFFVITMIWYVFAFGVMAS